jgi:hypothetical protein
VIFGQIGPCLRRFTPNRKDAEFCHQTRQDAALLTARLRSKTLSTIGPFLLSNALHQLQRAIGPNLEVPGRSVRSSALGCGVIRTDL